MQSSANKPTECHLCGYFFCIPFRGESERNDANFLARANDDCYDAIAGVEITAIVAILPLPHNKDAYGPVYFANSIWANSPPNYCYYAEMAAEIVNRPGLGQKVSNFERLRNWAQKIGSRQSQHLVRSPSRHTYV